jgi:uncharacterized protein YecE (DUF72 family)
MTLRIGTAGWTISREVREQFPDTGSGLERYAARFNAAEINTSFYRAHRPDTWARWAASVPADFRFAVKLPKAITHVARLVDCSGALREFADQITGLGERRGPILAQLPPSLAFDARVARTFLAALRRTFGGTAVIEPRHPSWFDPAPDALLAELEVARVAADPMSVPAAASPGGWRGLDYFRLHGSPHTYWSRYGEARITEWAGRIAGDRETWVIFDNTAGGGAAGDALTLAKLLAAPRR